LNDMKTKIEKEFTPIDPELFSNIMKLSDVIRYAYLIRTTSYHGKEISV